MINNFILFTLSFLLKIFEKITKKKTNYIHYAIGFYLDKKNPLILEIGAHNGEDTLKFAEWYPGGTIYTFEPDPRLTEYLLSIFTRVKNINFYPKAIYSDTDRVSFNLAKSLEQETFKNTGSSSLLDYREGSSKKFNKTTEVDAIHLSEIDHLNQNTVDLIWIDVQGAERIIVKSHKEIFAKSKLIWIEYGEADYSDYYTRDEIIKEFENSHSVSGFSNRGDKGNLLLVRS